MKKFVLASLGVGTAVTVTLAIDAPPAIPSGPVSYESVDYSSGDSDLYAYHNNTEQPAEWLTDTTEAPLQPSSISSLDSSDKNFNMKLNLYTSNYNVRGMGVTNGFSNNGYSSIDMSYTLPNRNLLGLGLYQQFSGSVGVIWGSHSELGDTPALRAGYAIGKEIFPNAHWTIGYNLQHGGLQGYMARATDNCSQRLAQDLYTTLKFDDHQRGFYGALTFGWGIQGLTGIYADMTAGYRLTDVISGNSMGMDVELEVGIAFSNDYWINQTEGVDAYRIRANILPYTHSGSLGRESGKNIIPWIMMSFAGNNEDKIDRAYGGNIIDDCQFTIGVDFNWSF
ncbi:MAG: hypothetical protein R3Y56_02570 [Akkermansia sp.]